MSYLSANDLRNLSEAYRRVHNKDEYELFFEDVIDSLTEDIEKLVSHGHDFSEYTWYELYESFFEEVIIPEFDDFGSILNTLNESSEELTEEKLLHLIEKYQLPNVQGLLSRLNVFKKAKPKPTVTTSVILDKSGKPIVKPTPLGGGKGTFERIGDWWKSVTTPKPKPAAPAATATPAAPAAPAAPAPAVHNARIKPQPTQPAPKVDVPKVEALPKPQGYQPTPSGVVRSLPQRGSNLKTRLGNLKTRTWDRLPAPVRGALKYGVGGVPLAVAGLSDVGNLVTGKPSNLQGMGADIVGRTGDLVKQYGRAQTALSKQFGSVEGQASGLATQQTGDTIKAQGQGIRDDLEKKNKEFLKQVDRKKKPPVVLNPSNYQMPPLPQ